MEYQLVVFELAREHYGVDISKVESIIKLQTITVVPHAPSYVEGVINLRGSILPVIDLHKRFGLQAEEASRNSRIVVVSTNGVKVGMIVDGVSEVLSVPEDAIEPPPPMVTTVDSAFITGIAKVGSLEKAGLAREKTDGRLVILLDLSKVLSIQGQSELIGMPAA
jgi:purine-binding chemotaxis protein CheW